MRDTRSFIGKAASGARINFISESLAELLVPYASRLFIKDQAHPSFCSDPRFYYTSISTPNFFSERATIDFDALDEQIINGN